MSKGPRAFVADGCGMGWTGWTGWTEWTEWTGWTEWDYSGPQSLDKNEACICPLSSLGFDVCLLDMSFSLSRLDKEKDI
jgi:hypothetical protein